MKENIIENSIGATTQPCLVPFDTTERKERERERKEGTDSVPVPESLRWSRFAHTWSSPPLSSGQVWLRRLEGRSTAGSGQPCSVNIHAAL